MPSRRARTSARPTRRARGEDGGAARRHLLGRGGGGCAACPEGKSRCFARNEDAMRVDCHLSPPMGNCTFAGLRHVLGVGMDGS
eukprot:932040-Prymnesium_polylepis.2